MKDYFTSDTHFGHAAIIEHCNRPYSSVEEMNEALIDNWNTTVSDKDRVFLLGDIVWGGVADAFEIFNKLNGLIYVVEGNHDRQWWGKTAYYSGSGKKVIPVAPQYVIKYRSANFGTNGKNYITINHYAMRTWYKAHAGGIHLFGHSHCRIPSLGRSFDIGVDCWDYKPVAIEEVEEHVKELRRNKPEEFEDDKEEEDDS